MNSGAGLSSKRSLTSAFNVKAIVKLAAGLYLATDLQLLMFAGFV
jgi:hypothetical protein